MKKTKHITVTLAVASVFSVLSIKAQTASTRLAQSHVIGTSQATRLPNFIKLKQEQQIGSERFVDWAVYSFNLPGNSTLKPYSIETDEIGFTHTRYKQYVNNYPVEESQVITHARNGKIEMVNGDYYQAFSASANASLNEQQALNKALNKVNAIHYMWEDKEHETTLRKTLNNPNFTFFPKGELVIVHKQKTNYDAENMRLAYKFNIYASEPLYRANVYVDAQTGEVIAEHNLIHTTDVAAAATTKYSGNVTITMDNFAANQYRLQETGRGNGITTQNLSTGTNYSAATDFITATNTWTVTGNDQAAADAHWGAEMTYDYYKNIHNRNSIDGAGYALPSYVHYSTNYVNAFWDGTEMTYGDGNVSQGFLIMTALDVCGHEITHGLTSFTSQLNGGGTDEASALNEGNSDIFGTTIEWYARPLQHDWLMGADITCTTSGVQNHVGIRDMSNPKNLGQPNCYHGVNWDPNGECHNNNGPFIYWYYLLCQGGSGTNDIGNTWAVTGITMNKAKYIAYRQNVTYFTPNTTYADARNYSIQAATDLYGLCSQELTSTTNAWYAVGVGAAATGAGVPTAAFTALNTSSCSAPLAVSFSNSSTGAVSYAWNFGDGNTSANTSPAHTYTAAGIYPVTLIATGTCSSTSKDTLVKTSYIKINGAPAVSGAGSSCAPQSFTLTANSVGNPVWTNASGTTVSTSSVFVTPVLSTTTSYSVTSSIQIPGTATTSGAPASNTTLGAGAYLGINNNHYLVFNATAGFTLKTVDIYAQSTTSVTTIQLQDASNNVLYSITPTLSVVGKNTIPLNWHIATGTGYKLMAVGTNGLYRNSAGATYPIAVSTVASITGNDVMGTAPTYYYWFYNWVVAADMTCTSAPTAVTNTIGSGTPVSFNYTGSSLCSAGTAITLTATPAGGAYSGTGVSGNQFNPSGLNGTYVLSYSYTSGGCTSSDTAHITVYQNPTIAFTYTAGPICDTISAVALSATPAGGTYSGTGVSGSQFHPAGLFGNYTLSYAYTSNGCSSSATTTVNVIHCSSSTGIASVNNTNSIDVFPNPSHDYIFITSNEDIVSIAVTDILGKALLTFSGDTSAKAQIDISSLASGMYFIKINTPTLQKQVSIIKE
ncbi:MAG: M4 family metallopeptidase [Bacteroidetes bacterium]|nr:M4 family metallopeptidase [Bacteroidota bacterium]